MNTKTNSNIHESVNRVINNETAMGSLPRMTSIEIAEVARKQHCDVMKAIRKMEPAWEKVCGGNFSLTSRTVLQPNGGTREVPCYELTKTECLYIATKFNDEARARLVLRWQLLEMAERRREQEGHPAAYATGNTAAGGTALVAAGGTDGTAPLIDLSGSRGSQVSIIVLMGADGQAVALTPEVVHQWLANAGTGALVKDGAGALVQSGLQDLVAGGLLPALRPELHPYHGPVRALVARTVHGIVREGVDDYTLYIRIPSKAFLEALDATPQEFFDAEFHKLMQAMDDEILWT